MGDRIAWRKGSRFKTDPESAYQEIERIREEGDGLATPSGIVDASRPPQAVLHPEFTWDDAVAAEEWRKEEARSIVQSLTVITESNGFETRSPALVSVVIGGGRGYQPTSVAFEDADSAEFVLAEALHSLRAWTRRYESLKSSSKLDRVWEAIADALGEDTNEK